MDAVLDRNIETVVLMSSSQIGKTEIMNNILGYYISQDPCPVLVMQPTLEMARTWSKDRLNPMLKSSKVLKGKVKEPRAKDSENTVLHKKYDGGFIAVVGANSASGLASRPVRILLADEVDRFPISAGAEGDPVSLALKRTTTFWNRKIVMASTPTIDGLSRIQTAFESSDKRRYFVPCPDCHEMQILEWSNVQWDEGKPETARYICVHCGSLLEEKEKIKMIRNGEWRAEEETNKTAGFHINELYSPWSTWGTMAINFLEAKKHPEILKTYINTSLGDVWRDQGEEIVSEGLMARRETYDESCIPDNVLVITGGVDIQSDRLELQVIGWGLESHSYVLDYQIFWGETSQAQVWGELDDYLKRRYERESLPSLPIACVGIDTGYQTQSCYNFVKNKTGRRIFGIKGQSQAGKPIAGRPTQSGRQRIQLFPAGVDTAKENIFQWLQIDEVGPGYVHFPNNMDEEYFKQLTAEKRAVKFYKGEKRVVWVAQRERNEALDTFVYCLVALHILQPDLKKISSNNKPPKEESIKRNNPITNPTLRTIKRPRKSFVNSWK
ncbi:MAG: putative terminase large subunit [Prokaryotic dsDNA virus sp.]|nr:MAG: putative terminase large subunit [Prokaryotic dsDNA virus sp.]|tara:strand:- start:22767 stop:24428 length:1662 start_codon:yes stop_codon:yes gene_type:complete